MHFTIPFRKQISLGGDSHFIDLEAILTQYGKFQRPIYSKWILAILMDLLAPKAEVHVQNAVLFVQKTIYGAHVVFNFTNPLDISAEVIFPGQKPSYCRFPCSPHLRFSKFLMDGRIKTEVYCSGIPSDSKVTANNYATDFFISHLTYVI